MINVNCFFSQLGFIITKAFLEKGEKIAGNVYLHRNVFDDISVLLE